MMLLSDFFNINSEVRADLVIKFNLEQDVKRLFECILPNDPVLSNKPTQEWSRFSLKCQKYSVQHLHLYTQTTTHTQLCNEENTIKKANSFSTLTTFESTGVQFKWMSISLITVLSKKHRNTYVTYDAEMAHYMIRKNNNLQFKGY